MEAKFPPQFPRSKVNQISFACTLIEHLSLDGTQSIVSTGSGSFWRNGDRTLLVTARHVITGRSPFDNSILSGNGFIPELINVYPTLETDPNIWQRIKMQIPIDQAAENWLQDPEFDELRTDIVAIELPFNGPQKVKCVNDDPDINDALFSAVGMDCSIVGYPSRHFAGLMSPIWRRGAIASEPLLPIDGKPMFLLDASTGPGFSGAPVFRQHFGPLPVLQDNGSVDIVLDSVRKISFVGVYAGRLENAHVGGEVPFVFYGNRIPIILEQ